MDESTTTNATISETEEVAKTNLEETPTEVTTSETIVESKQESNKVESEQTVVQEDKPSISEASSEETSPTGESLKSLGTCESLSAEIGTAESTPVGPAAVPSSSSKDRDKEKINIRLNPVGDAPILKQKLWAVPAEREVGQIIEFVKKYLKLEPHQSLFLFVNQAFAPSPDQQLKELYECFGSDGKIVLHYSTTYAWG